MLSPILAYRPPSVLGRLPPHSDACPLSLRDILGAAGSIKLPIVEAGTPDVVRAVLVAAKVFHSTVGLAIPRGVEPVRWFRAVAAIADEIAAALPIFLSAEVTLEGENSVDVERSLHELWRLLEAGLTHLTIDASAAPPEERGRILAEVAAPLHERGLAFDCAIALGEQGAGRRAVVLVDELARLGVPPDAASVRCPAPADAEAARAQVGALDRLSEVLQGVPVLRRGPVSPALFEAVRGSRLRACADGGWVAGSSVASAAEPEGTDAADRRARWQDRAAELLGEAEAERLEAHTFLSAAAFIEGLGAEQSAPAIARELERRQAEDQA